MPKKKTLDDFIEEAIKLYGDKYEYSEVVYKNSSTKVKIICKEHGPFLKTPQKFINAKQGCRECTGYKKWSWQRFVKEAKVLYSGKYKYPIQKFTKTKALYTIICPIHGEFKQSIYHHLRGGCNKCAVELRNENQRYSQEEFIAKAKKIHGNKYDYSKVKYTNSQTKIKIICSIHGEFEMKANNHTVQNQGCPDCGREKANINMRISYEKVLNRFKSVHRNKYKYIKESYVDYTTEMKIICNKHGEFYMKPHTHYSMKAGCPVCKSSKGEISIKDYLDDNNIEFERQKTFEGLKGVNKLRCDYYIPSKNLIIEFNGRQHYEAIELWGGVKSFKILQKNDALKKEFCLNNKINFEVIKYDEDVVERMEEIISKY